MSDLNMEDLLKEAEALIPPVTVAAEVGFLRILAIQTYVQSRAIQELARGLRELIVVLTASPKLSPAASSMSASTAGRTGQAAASGEITVASPACENKKTKVH